MDKAIIVREEDVERIERQLDHLDKLSMKFWKSGEEAEKAGDKETARRYSRKSDTADEKYMAMLYVLDILGFSWHCTSKEDGTENIHLCPP